MTRVLVFEAEREGYTLRQVGSPMTVGQLKEFLEDYNDDTLFMLSHDRGYTYGSISLWDFKEVDLDEEEE